MQKVLILGIGNLLQKDDGVGSHIIQHIIDADIKLPDGTEAIDGGTAGYDLIPLMINREKIVIIDALKANDAPGSVYRFSPKHLLSSREIYSQHDLGVREIIKQLNLLGDNPEIEIIGIVPEDIESLEIGLSDSVRNSIPKAVDQILSAAVI